VLTFLGDVTVTSKLCVSENIASLLYLCKNSFNIMLESKLQILNGFNCCPLKIKNCCTNYLFPALPLLN